MKHTVNSYYFSPTGGTKIVMNTFCNELENSAIDVNLGGKAKGAVRPAADIMVVK